MLAEPRIDFRLFVIGGIILDEIDAVAASEERRQQDLLEKIDIGFGVEVFGLMPVGEPALIQGNGAQDLLGVALATGEDLRLSADRRPGLVKRGRLAEGGFVLVNDYRLFLPGFFLRLG